LFFCPTNEESNLIEEPIGNPLIEIDFSMSHDPSHKEKDTRKDKSQLIN